jgi:hypothetical protein
LTLLPFRLATPLLRLLLAFGFFRTLALRLLLLPALGFFRALALRLLLLLASGFFRALALRLLLLHASGFFRTLALWLLLLPTGLFLLLLTSILPLSGLNPGTLITIGFDLCIHRLFALFLLSLAVQFELLIAGLFGLGLPFDLPCLLLSSAVGAIGLPTCSIFRTIGARRIRATFGLRPFGS